MTAALDDSIVIMPKVCDEMREGVKWWRCRDSNPGHRDYDSPALPAELHRPENLEATILYCRLFVKRNMARFRAGFESRRSSYSLNRVSSFCIRSISSFFVLQLMQYRARGLT